MTSNYDTYYKDELNKRKKAVDDALAERKTTDTNLKEQINATIDQSAAAQVGVYEQEIEQAPLDSRVQYDRNAMAAAVDRKKIAESLANMGMTDSGLSSSMNTAIAVQKSRADNQVRVDEQQRIRAAQSTIDQILAGAANEKAAQGIAIDKATTDWEREQRLNADKAASEVASTMYAADVESKTKEAERQQGIIDNRGKLAQSYINNGMDPAEAWGQAYYTYPDTSTTEGYKYAIYNEWRAQGYDSQEAQAMATAYANTVLTGGTTAQATEAANAALKTVREEKQKAAAAAQQAAYAEKQAAATEDAVKRTQTETDNRSKLAQNYINKGMDTFEAWGQAYYAYPDTSTVEGYKYAVYNQFKSDGYDNRYAQAMATAYVNARANGGTEADGNKAVGDAMVAEAKKEIADAKIGGFLSELGAPKAKADNVDDVVSYYTKKYQKEGLSTIALNYAVAQKVGEKYAEVIANGDDETVKTVGAAIDAAFENVGGSLYAEIALAAAGVTWK